MSEGKKYDRGKIRFDLIPPRTERILAEVLTYGANKYGEYNWRLVEHHRERYLAALRRHLNAWQLGETLDQESGLSHLGHALCCVVFLLDQELEERDIAKTDSSGPSPRPRPEPASPEREAKNESLFQALPWRKG